MKLEQCRVGVDIGRVLMAPTGEDGGADTSFLSGSDEAALETPPSEGAFDVVRELVSRTGGAVWLVSKAGPRIEALTQRWLRAQRFHELTGVRHDRVKFCRERADKAGIADRLDLNVFIDDRLDVLQHLRPVVPRLFLFGHQRRGTVVPDWLTHVLDWSEARAAILEGVKPERSPPVPDEAPPWKRYQKERYRAGT
jgi:hypothetical protein